VDAGTTSGNTIGDEYQRTVGAFFAIYWLMRLEVDGRKGFTYGVGARDWVPLGGMPKDEESGEEEDGVARDRFYADDIWTQFTQLFIAAGLLKEERRWFGGKVMVVNQKRLVSLLALTAVHDIMKMGLLWPQVQQKDAPYLGYSAGDTISDHDHALSYLMEHYPELLPSFSGLEPEDKRAVYFTQCNLGFNFGWFVQAEAPPGATLSAFRDTLIRDHKAELGRQDVALYFVHWLTDLAGAEPSPLGGCEKFVLRFPLKVLRSFLQAFDLARTLTDNSETEVFENYLHVRWTEHQPNLGPPPTGDSAIARMRLLCQAQENAREILRAFDDLSDEDREVLSVEMARTGTLCQSYSAGLVPPDVRNSPAGPAFLVYYGPAFLQSNLGYLGSEQALHRLGVLSEVYRRARELWPANIAKAGQNVSVRIDMIKSLTLNDMLEAMSKGDVWLMMKHNDREAFVERCSKRKLNKLIAAGQTIQILDLTTVKGAG